MVPGSSGALKPGRKERYAVLPTEIRNRLGESELGLHGVRENTKEESAHETSLKNPYSGYALLHIARVKSVLNV